MGEQVLENQWGGYIRRSTDIIDGQYIPKTNTTKNPKYEQETMKYEQEVNYIATNQVTIQRTVTNDQFVEYIDDKGVTVDYINDNEVNIFKLADLNSDEIPDVDAIMDSLQRTENVFVNPNYHQ